MMKLTRSFIPQLRLSPSVSLTLGIVSLTLAIFWLLDLTIGILPDHQQTLRENREEVSTSLSLQIASLIKNQENDILSETLSNIVNNNDKIDSIGIRSADGQLIQQGGDHEHFWAPPPPNKSTLKHVQIPIQVEGRPWATIEISFADSNYDGNQASTGMGKLVLPVLIVTLGFLAYYLYLTRVLQHLDPTRVIPERVGTALDTLTEGVMITDVKHRVMLLNRAFRDLHPDAPQLKIGERPCDHQWIATAIKGSQMPVPWIVALETGKKLVNQQFKLVEPGKMTYHLLINASPIEDGKQQLKGCLTTFQDITAQIESQEKLKHTLKELQKTHRKIEKQNKELYLLANHDQLTGLYNRRAFFQFGEEMFEQHGNSGEALACIMCDIDHFKRVNDNYGHAAGDDAIKTVASFLRGTVRPQDIVGRYGGEEFCILLPGVKLEIASEVSERLRAKIEAKAGLGVRSVAGLKLTSSFGISMLSATTPSLSALIDHADQALYNSKETGRNRVSIYSEPDT